jgi:ABC-type polar amino acid transport system ATPase subunit
MADGGGASHLVELERVRKSFGDNVVLDEIELAIGHGEVIVIAGPSGSGKSTMLRCINGLEPIDSGEIRFDGSPLATSGRALSRIRQEIGMVFQQCSSTCSRTRPCWRTSRSRRSR